MPYSATDDPHTDTMHGLMTLGRKGRAVVPSDATDIVPYAKAVVVTVAGNLVILPTQNADGQTITFTGAPVGFVPPYEVRRVYATGTTASVATVDT